jgi:hypothetical protein
MYSGSETGEEGVDEAANELGEGDEGIKVPGASKRG